MLLPLRGAFPPPSGVLKARAGAYRRQACGLSSSVSSLLRARLIHCGTTLPAAADASGSDSTWAARFQELKAHKEATGYFSGADEPLASWVKQQQHNRDMAPHKKAQLEAVGFSADCYDMKWNYWIAELQQYIAEHGDALVPAEYSENRRLGSWVTRTRCHKAKLSTARVQQLGELGFVWDAYGSIWEQRMAELRSYKRINGDTNVPKGYHDNKQLGTWVTEVRRSRRNEKLSEERIRQLDDVGFNWTVPTSRERWHAWLPKLERYALEHGNCNVPQSAGSLGNWVAAQRRAKTDGKLDDSQIETLERLGMHWSRRDTTFDANIAALEAFVASHGHANATKKDGALGDFVSKQRTYKRNLDAGKQSPLTQDRIARLDAIDFCWDPAEADWQKQAERLRAHYAAGEEWGSMGKSLKAWVSKQRRNKRALDVGGKTTMSPSRVAILERIGLRWD